MFELYPGCCIDFLEWEMKCAKIDFAHQSIDLSMSQRSFSKNVQYTYYAKVEFLQVTIVFTNSGKSNQREQ